MAIQMDVPPQLDEKNMSHKELKALAKARRPWYLKKRFWLLGVVGIIIIASVAGSSGSKDNSNSAQPGSVTQDTKATETGSNAKLFPGRVDAQRADKERNIGQSVELSGYTATVTAAGYQASVSDFEKGGYVVSDVTILNRDDRAQSYNTFDWKLQTPSGQVLDPTFTTVNQLGSGDLVKGGSVAGKVVFEVGSQKGDFYIIYKPDAFDSDRGIWKVTH
jgi:uncharacterized protein DUF4352